jgi:hypothetical protein
MVNADHGGWGLGRGVLLQCVKSSSGMGDHESRNHLVSGTDLEKSRG